MDGSKDNNREVPAEGSMRGTQDLSDQSQGWSGAGYTEEKDFVGLSNLGDEGVKEKGMLKRTGNLSLVSRRKDDTINRKREGRREDKRALTH